MVVIVDEENFIKGNEISDDSMTVEKALNATAQGKKIGTLKIDPASLTVRAPGNNQLKTHFLKKAESSAWS